jgi:hypothetical protein
MAVARRKARKSTRKSRSNPVKTIRTKGMIITVRKAPRANPKRKARKSRKSR